MADDGSEKTGYSEVSPYLLQPRRTLEQALQDSDAFRHHLVSGPQGETEPWDNLGSDPTSSQTTVSADPSAATAQRSNRQR